MKCSVVQFCFIVLSLVFMGAIEDMLPSLGPVGFPVLLGGAVFFASDVRTPFWLLAAVAAGAFEEALSAQPPGTGIVFFAGAASAARFVRRPMAWRLVAYPAYQAWLGLVADGSGAFGRFLVSVPLGVAVIMLTSSALSWSWGKAGADA